MQLTTLVLDKEIAWRVSYRYINHSETVTKKRIKMEIEGKTFLVTGGARGMGRCFTMELAKLGANVVFCDINQAGIEAVETKAALEGVEVRAAERQTEERGSESQISHQPRRITDGAGNVLKGNSDSARKHSESARKAL